MYQAAVTFHAYMQLSRSTSSPLAGPLFQLGPFLLCDLCFLTSAHVDVFSNPVSLYGLFGLYNLHIVIIINNFSRLVLSFILALFVYFMFLSSFVIRVN